MKTKYVHVRGFNIDGNHKLNIKTENGKETSVLFPHKGFAPEYCLSTELQGVHIRNDEGEFFKILSIAEENVLIHFEEIHKRYGSTFKKPDIKEFCKKWKSQIWANEVKVQRLQKSAIINFTIPDKIKHYLEKKGVCGYCKSDTLFPFGRVVTLKESDFKKVEEIIEKQNHHIDEYKGELIDELFNIEFEKLTKEQQDRRNKFESLITNLDVDSKNIKEELMKNWNKGEYKTFRIIVDNLEYEGKYEKKKHKKFLLKTRKFFLEEYLRKVNKKKPQFKGEFDHKLDKALGGDGTFENINLTCTDCNKNKRAELDCITYDPKTKFIFFEDEMPTTTHNRMLKKTTKICDHEIEELKVNQSLIKKMKEPLSFL